MKCRYKKTMLKKKISLSSCFIMIVATILLFNNFIIMNIFKGKNNGLKNKISSLSIRDFNDEVIDEGLFIDESIGFLANSIFYTANGKNMRLSYDLLESEYKWVINWNFNKMMEWFESQGIMYTEVKSSLPSFIKAYSNEDKSNYILLSENKIIEIIGLEKDKDKIINIVYNKVFKDTKEEIV